MSSREEKDPKSGASKIEKLILKISEEYPILKFRTQFDKNELPCILDLLYHTIKSFILSFGPISIIKALLLLKNPKLIKNNPLIILSTMFSMKNVKIGLFLGSYTFIFKSTIIIMRILRNKDDGKEAALGGLLAGYLSMFFIDGSKFLSIFLLLRAFDCILNSKLKDEKLKNNIIFAFYSIAVSGIIGFWLRLPSILSPSLNRYVDRWGIQQASDYEIARIIREICFQKDLRSYLQKS